MTRIFFAFLGILTTAALVVKFGIDVGSKGGLAPAAISFFGYFTNWSNILVAVVCLTVAARPEWSELRISLVTATTMFILFVGVVYHALLAADHRPEGIARITNILMHYIVPGGAMVLWLAFVPKGQLRFGAAFVWLIFPATYLAFALLRGAVLDHYPYFFVNVNTYGLAQVLVNAVGFTGFLLVLGLGFIGLDRMLGRAKRSL